MKRVVISVVAICASFVLFGGNWAHAASQSENESALRHAVGVCRDNNWSGDACRTIKQIAESNNNSLSNIEVRKGKTHTIYQDVVDDSDLIGAVVDCDSHSANCINDKYHPRATTSPGSSSSGGAGGGGGGGAATPLDAKTCKDNGGVPVSSALGVSNNCVGGKQPDGSEKNPIFDLLSILVRFATGLFGLVLVLMVAYAGIRYVISAGSPDEVKEAKNHLKSAATGLVLFVLMSGLLQFILPPEFRVFG